MFTNNRLDTTAIMSHSHGTYWVVAGIWFMYIFEVSTIGNLNCQPWWCHPHPIPQGCDDDCSVPFFADDAQVLARYSPKSQPSQLPIPQVLSADPHPPGSVLVHAFMKSWKAIQEDQAFHGTKTASAFFHLHMAWRIEMRQVDLWGWSHGASAAKASESSSLYNATCGGWGSLGFQDIPNSYKHQAVTHFPGRLRNTSSRYG